MRSIEQAGLLGETDALSTRAQSFNPSGGEGESVEWYTPPEIFAALSIDFDLDPASPEAGPVAWVPAKRFYTPTDNGLLKRWEGRVWLNPPYGRGIGLWASKMVEHGDGMLLTFVRTDTEWWQRAAAGAEAIAFIKGRVKFIPNRPPRSGSITQPGAASCLLAYGAECAEALRRSDLGVVLP